MLWVWAILSAAVCNALRTVVTRRMGDSLDVFSIAFFSSVLMLPVLWLAVAWSGVYGVETDFWWLMVLMLPVEVLVMFLFFSALTSSDLSRSFPFVSFMPFFVAIGAYVILGEVLSAGVYLGAGLLMLGAFVLQFESQKKSNIRGALYILVVATLWGYLIPMGNLAITYSSPQLYPAIYFTCATILFLPLYFMRATASVTEVRATSMLFVGAGLLYAGFTLAQWYAYSLGPATAVSALAMVSVPLTILFSTWFTKDALTPRRFFGAAAMIIGAVVIILIG